MGGSLSGFMESFPSELMSCNVPMAEHSSFAAGGFAKLLFTPDSTGMLAEAVRFCRDNDINHYVVGNCTNTLVRDGGFDGVIIKTSSKISVARIRDEVHMKAEAGALLSALADLAYDKGLTGLEFASGIPGSLGGAVYMNAGAYNYEMKDVVLSAKVLDQSGQIINLPRTELGFGYRMSAAQSNGYIVLSAVLSLQHGDKDAIRKRIDELAALRAEKQPLKQYSAGSTFKRPKGYYAGKLIADAGLRGYSMGGAMVSEKHAGFIVNHDNATASDIISLMEYVIATVKQKYGVTLEPEVRIIGTP